MATIDNQLIKENEQDSEDVKKYKEATAFDAHQVGIEGRFETGTMAIDEGLAKKAILSVSERIEATKEYTEARIDRIDRNYKAYMTKDFDPDSETELTLPETTISVEDWVDDLYLVFHNLEETIDLEDNSQNVKKTFAQVLKVDADEGDLEQGLFARILGFIRERPTSDQLAEKGKINFIEYLKRLYGFFVKEEDTYFFRKGDVIKEFLKFGINRSEFKNVNQKGEEALNSFLTMGLISGHFCYKEVWGSKRKFKLNRHQTTDSKKGKTSLGTFQYTLDDEEVYQFIPQDTRNLIFRQDRIDWVIEKIDTKFSTLMTMTVDAKGKVKDNAMFDVERLKKIAEKIKEVPKTQDDKANQNILNAQSTDINMDEIMELEGDVTVFEGHHIPLKLKDRVAMCIITLVQIGGDESAEYFPIRIQETPYFELPYKFTNFFEDKADVAGMGLPHLVEVIQEQLNTLIAFSHDMMNMAVWGILAIDEDVLEDPTQLDNITPKVPIKVKNMAGKSVRDIINWYTPPIEIINFVQPMIEQLRDVLNRLSRKGSTGQKISPNPSATEASNIISESEKSVNRLALRLNGLFEKMVTNMYVYYMLNREESMKINVTAQRLVDPNEAKEVQPEINSSIISEVEKSIEITPEDIFIDGLNFKVSAVETADKQAVERQQAMQSLNLLLPLATDPATGGEKIYIDQNGTQHTMDTFKLISEVSNTLGLGTFWKKPTQQQQPAPTPLSPQGRGGPEGVPSISTPQLSASPNEADILAGVQQV